MEDVKRGVQFEFVNGSLWVNTRSIHDLLHGNGLIKSDYHDWKRRVLNRYKLIDTIQSVAPVAEDGKQISRSSEVLIGLNDAQSVAKMEMERKIEQKEIWKRVFDDCESIYISEEERGDLQILSQGSGLTDAEIASRVPSEQNGKKSILDLSFSDLNEIAEIARITRVSLASLGLSEKEIQDLSRKLVKRKLGLEV